MYLWKEYPKFFPAGPFFSVFQINVYWSALILRNLLCPEKFLVMCSNLCSISIDISRDYWFIFSYKFCMRIIHYIFNVSLIIAFNESSNAKISPLDNLLILTYFFLALSMLLTAHTKRLNVSVCNNFHLFFPQNFPTLSCSHSVSFSKMFRIFPMIFSIK